MKNIQSHLYSTIVYKTCKRSRIEEEAALPDYCSSVSRVIRTEAYPLLRSKKVYVRDNTLFCEISGEVAFNVVYASDGGEIESYSYSTDINDTVKADVGGIDDDSVFAFAVISAENPVCKVQSPRRVSVRCEVCLNVDAGANKSLDCYVKGDGSVETRERSATVLKGVCSKDGEFKVSEEIKLPKSCPPMERILSVSVAMEADDAVTGDNSVRFIGNAGISCVYMPEEESEKGMCSFYQPLELKGSVEVEDSAGDMCASVRLVPSFCTWEIMSDNLGENRVLKVDISYIAQCLVEENTALTLTEDIYGVGRRIVPAYDSAELRRYVGTLREENAIKEKMPLKKDIRSLEGLTAIASVKDTFFKDGELYANCRIIVSAIGITDDLPCSISESIDTVIRLNLPTEVSGYSGDLSFDIGTQTGYVDAKVEDGNAALAFDVTVIARIYCSDSADYVASVESGDPIARDGERIFCYPSDSDTLWTVGKRYGVAVSALAEANSMTSTDQLKRVMIIP